MSKVSTYLNFPRNTERAFNFYKSVFEGEFRDDYGEGGILRFGDILLQGGMPSMAEGDKNLIMHIEMPILGGHVLMRTDAPESMSFKVNFGSNVHINLKPDTRQETKNYLMYFR